MIVIYVLSAVWVVRLLLNLLSYIHLWFVKEYRFDRMVIHLKTKQGMRLLFLPWRRPPISPKSIFVFIATLFVCVAVFLGFPWFIFYKLLLIDFLLFPVTAIFVLIAKFPTFLYHRLKISRAVRKLRAHKKMIVIGITGSYGKTTTKEILATILSQKFKTLKTEASKNSPIGIAEVVLSKLLPEHEVFIVEMGAYKRGEIAQMCAMVKPEIGIVTAINEQHQDLFGTIEETVNAKYELIQGLCGKKIAIFNADNPYTKEMSERAKKDGKNVILYSARAIQSTIRSTDGSMAFEVKNKLITVQLTGVHQVSNILAAATAAMSIGMTLPEIAKACSHVQPFAHTMRPMTGVNGSTFIDDTFNNNPDAARAAIDYLKETKGKKILVFQPMIELGSFAHKKHQEIGTYAGSVCDNIILTNDSYSDCFPTGVVLSASAAAAHIRAIVKKGDTVLFKGKEAARVLNAL